jgi:ATP-binding cassette subfamily G (WHITE) protein 2 (SNQ2)
VLRSEVVYMSEHDVHFATLSLEASMMPASLAKTPRVRERGQGRREWATERLRSYVDALGLGHAMGTAVGNSFVRGLSGGERKRASIIEALITRASVLLLDKPTSGLDSSTALELITYLRSWAKEGKKSLVATAPHIADPLYLQFDKVLVLSSKGRQVYFGKTTDAQSYFEGLGLRFRRRTAAGEGCAEFIVGCIEGRGLDHELERSWRSSGERKALIEEMKEYEARYPFDTCAGPLLAAVQDEKSRWTRNSSHYTVSFVSQIVILTRRQYALVASELPTYVTKTIVNLLISVLVGTLFFNLPETTSAAFTRGSLLLLSVVFNAYLSLAELGKTLEGRDIVKRQGDWGFFGASALALARLAGDVPLIGAQVLLFGTITYTLAGLQVSPCSLTRVPFTHQCGFAAYDGAVCDLPSLRLRDSAQSQRHVPHVRRALPLVRRRHPLLWSLSELARCVRPIELS